MRTLLDANVLIALFDTDHLFHNRCFEWFENSSSSGWASCPLTQNAVLRVLSNSNYSSRGRFTLHLLVEKFRELTQKTDHEFWPDDISLLDAKVLDSNKVLGHRQLTDIYLLALATRYNGVFVTFDTRIPIAAALSANTKNLEILR